MDIWKKIKKCLPSLIKFSFGPRVQYNITIYNIGDISTKEYKEIIEKGIGLVKSGIEKDLEEILNFAVRNKILKKLKKYLPNHLYACFLLAMRTIDAEDKGEIEKNKKLFNMLEERFPIIGRRVYNLLRSREFKEFIYPYLEYLEKNYKSATEISEKFSKLVSDVIEFYPFAIWVSKEMERKDIINSILSRKEVLEKMKFLKIYARSRSVKKLTEIKERIIERLEKIFGKDKIIWQEKMYKLGRTEAIEVILILKE